MARLRFLTGFILMGALMLVLGALGEAAEPAGKTAAFEYPSAYVAGDGSQVSGEERQAVTLVVKAFDAYNKNDPSLIKQADWRYLDMKDEEVRAKFAPVGGFRLHDVKVDKAAPDSLTTYILYSWEMAGDKNRYYAVALVSLAYRDNAWGIVDTVALPDSDNQELARQAAKAGKRFGAADLREWKGLLK
ncbi:MAG TPA: hypothetical protein PKA10_09775 [Selenomonadales bacterium]|nr:hypothetical protein [Selenomonadales bacterium]